MAVKMSKYLTRTHESYEYEIMIHILPLCLGFPLWKSSCGVACASLYSLCSTTNERAITVKKTDIHIYCCTHY